MRTRLFWIFPFGCAERFAAAKNVRQIKKQQRDIGEKSEKMGQKPRKSNPGALEERAQHLGRFEGFAREILRSAGMLAVIGVDHLHCFRDFA